MPVVVVYDANVLYPSTLRDVLIRVGLARLARPKWTDRILDEVFGNLRANRPDLDSARLDRTRRLMNDAIRDVTVTGYERLIDQLDLPDPDDRHVLAAAIHAESQVIVTRNLRDFPRRPAGPVGCRGAASRRLPQRTAPGSPGCPRRDRRGDRTHLGRRCEARRCPRPPGHRRARRRHSRTPDTRGSRIEPASPVYQYLHATRWY